MVASKRMPCVVAALLIGACSSSVQRGLDEPAANEVVLALERAGISASKQAERGDEGTNRFEVRVRRGDAARAIDRLRSLGLPRQRRHGFSEVYSQPSLIPTASEERARYTDALAGEIERTLETVEGVVASRVHLVMEEADPLAATEQPRVPARAAVLLKTVPGKQAPLGATEVQRLVAGSVPGLAPEAVAVVITAAPEPTEGDASTVQGHFGRTGDRTVLLAAAAAGLLLSALLAVLLLVTVRRLAALQRRAASIPAPHGAPRTAQ